MPSVLRYHCRQLPAVLLLVAVHCLGAANTTPPLRSAASILHLSPEQAALKPEVQLAGTIVTKTASNVMHVHDGDRCVTFYVEASSPLRGNLNPGRRLRLEGRADPGKFAPVIHGRVVEDLGEAPIPPARRVSMDALSLVGEDGQWIELTGIVRSAQASSEKDSLLLLASGKERILVHVAGLNATASSRLVDSVMTVRGICLHYFNTRGQFFETRIYCADDAWSCKDAPATSADGPPLRSAASLLRYAPEGISPHRVRIRGRVTFTSPDGWLQLQDEDSGLRVSHDYPSAPPVGHLIEALGFVAPAGMGPSLEDATINDLGPAAHVPARPLSARQGISAEGLLVRVRGTVDAAVYASDHWRLSLDVDGAPFDLFLAQENFTPPRPGSQVEATGVLRARMDEAAVQPRAWVPSSHELLARTPADITLLETPPLSRRDLVLWTLLPTAGLGLLWSMWRLLIARRRLTEQRSQRERAEASFLAVHTERNRMAREIHDTLAQGLTSVSMQVELARNALTPQIENPDKARAHLETARSFVRTTLGDLRRTLQALRPQILEHHSLPSALEKTGAQLTEGTGIRFTFKVEGSQYALPPYLESDLLHITQETITNAVRHAHPSLVELTLTYSNALLVLRVRDDGRGFPSNGPHAHNSDGAGFGLRGLRERLEPYCGTLDISTGSNGSTILISIPRE